MAENKSNIECRIGNKVDLSCDGFQDCEGWRPAQIINVHGAVFINISLLYYFVCVVNSFVIIYIIIIIIT